MLKKLFVAVLLFHGTFLFSQIQTNIWYFGAKAGITFNTTPPSALLDGQVNTSEGCATISDDNGNILFYTDGITVWNKNHTIMPNGTGLLGDPSAAQSAVIVPKPGSLTNYYIFTTPEQADIGMRYSEVDITLNGGLGDVLNSNKNTLLYTNSSEKVTVIKHANDVYFWVIGRKRLGADSKIYMSFLVDCNGVDAANPVVSNVGITDAQNWGYLVASPDGKRLASASSSSGIEITDFDNVTGAISNPTFLGSLNYSSHSGGNYGISFSPNSKVLYASSITNWALVQWDLTATNIPSTELYLGDVAGSGANRPIYRGGALQIGPDGKIYIAHTGTSKLGVINNPNVVGAGCDFQNNVIDLGGKICRLGLPPFIMSYFNESSINFTNYCKDEVTQFQLTGATYLDSVRWNFDDPSTGANNTSTLFNPTHQFSAPGVYNVALIRHLDCVTDTIYQNVTIVAPASEEQTITLCDNSSYTLPDGQIVNEPGTYVSTILNYLGCDSIVTTHLVQPQTDFSAGNDQYICKGETAQLQTTGSALNYSWLPAGSLSNSTIANPIVTPTETTTYVVSSQVQLSNNLIINGDFEQGNTLFSTEYKHSSPSPLDGPGHYTVSTGISNGWWENCGDHTSGSGNMLIADGANNSNGVSAASAIWCQTIQINPDTDYAFSTWLINTNSSGNTSKLGFFINGVQVGQTQDTPLGACQWNQFYVIWNSGTNLTADVCIKEMSGQQPGNDFALDDISFYQICTITDSVTVHVSDLKVAITKSDVQCYDNADGTISISPEGGIGTYTYTWSNGASENTLNNLSEGDYSVTIIDSINCQLDTTVFISQPPLLELTTIANNIIECGEENTGNATVTPTGGTPNYTYEWSNQETTQTATQLSEGYQFIKVTDANGCEQIDSVFIEKRPAPTAQISATDNCTNETSVLVVNSQTEGGETIVSTDWMITNASQQTIATGNTSTLEVDIATSGNYTATVNVTSSNGCTTVVQKEFEKKQIPNFTLEYDTECFQVANFNAINNDGQNLTYSWDIYNNGEVDYNTPSFSQYFDDATPFVIRLSASNDLNCSHEIIENIAIVEGKADIEFPNVLSLKSLVGNNEINIEQIMPNFNSCIDYTLTIVNRWGNTVFEVKNDKNNPDLNCANCFKGKTNKGNDLSPGTYFYLLQGEYDIQKSGFITIID